MSKFSFQRMSTMMSPDYGKNKREILTINILTRKHGNPCTKVRGLKCVSVHFAGMPSVSKPVQVQADAETQAQALEGQGQWDTNLWIEGSLHSQGLGQRSGLREYDQRRRRQMIRNVRRIIHLKHISSCSFPLRVVDHNRFLILITIGDAKLERKYRVRARSRKTTIRYTLLIVFKRLIGH